MASLHPDESGTHKFGTITGNDAEAGNVMPMVLDARHFCRVGKTPDGLVSTESVHVE